MGNSDQDDKASEGASPATTKLTRTMGIALAAVGVILALIAVDVVLINGIQPAQARSVTHVVKISGAPVVQPTVYLTVSPGRKARC